MAKSLNSYRVTQVVMTVRFVQGYRYLDKCGEALIRLEETLDRSWIPGQISPVGGLMKSDLHATSASFDSEHVSVIQFDSVGSLEQFQDAAIKIYSTLISTLEISRILSPAVALTAQKGANSLEDAERGIVELDLAQPGPKVRDLLKQLSNSKVTWISEHEDSKLSGTPVKIRTRLEGGAIIQTPKPGFDDRLLKRARLLGERQREAMDILRKLRLDVPKIPTHAIQLQVERSIEEELRESTFDMSAFLEQTWNWGHDAIATLTGST